MIDLATKKFQLLVLIAIKVSLELGITSLSSILSLDYSETFVASVTLIAKFGALNRSLRFWRGRIRVVNRRGLLY